MKKQSYLIIMLILILFGFRTDLYAFQHAYQRHTEEVYALARQDLAVYYDESGEDLIEYIPAFTGIKVIYIGDSWREIEYTIDGKDKIGWVTRDDFYSDCLIYDGREKQILADGCYQFTYKNRPAFDAGPSIDTDLAAVTAADCSFPVSITFAGNGYYTIFRTDTDEYLLPDTLFGGTGSAKRWGSIGEAGLFELVRRDDYYGIKDSCTNRYIGPDENGLFAFHDHNDRRFRVIRTNGKVLEKNDLRVYAQYDPEWAMDYYGRGENEDPLSNNFCTSGCGVFSLVNAIYTLTGNFADPHFLADYAVRKDFRIEDNGTDSEFFHAFAGKYGYRYGFRYDGATGSIDEIKQKLEDGDVVIAHVPGHYLAIVDYSKKTNRFLLLDSHYLPRRGTSPYGDWVAAAELEGDGLYGFMYYFLKAVDE